ncbi:hypothetical protein F5Y14DRAFT_420018 [Nemania sp. NC0429]|nr:hypothetical protein F5Y14DRAFT_420018 [Nemania sp. NC0429]
MLQGRHHGGLDRVGLLSLKPPRLDVPGSSPSSPTSASSSKKRLIKLIAIAAVSTILVTVAVTLAVLKGPGELTPNVGGANSIQSTPWPSSTSNPGGSSALTPTRTLSSRVSAETSTSSTSSQIPSRSVPTDNDSIHLVDCVGPGNYSSVLYCADDSNCQHVPSAANIVRISSDGYCDWEQQNQTATFSTGTVFTWDIDISARVAPVYHTVGHGNNGYNNYDCLKDNHHVMYNDGEGDQCQSVYYCIRSSR